MFYRGLAFTYKNQAIFLLKDKKFFKTCFLQRLSLQKKGSQGFIKKIFLSDLVLQLKMLSSINTFFCLYEC